MKTITRGGEQVRPSFNFSEHGDGYPYDSITAQMTENMRNLLEEQHSTLLRQERALQAIELLLRRLDRRLATRMPLKRGGR